MRALKPWRRAAGRIVRSETLRRLAWQTYPTAKLYTHARLRLAPKRPPLLIYTMGKVGSLTVARSLAASHPELSVYQIHWLDAERLQREEAIARRARRRHGVSIRPAYIWRGQYLRRRLAEARGWPVVTLVRDPVARNVSSFFQNLRVFYGYRAERELAAKGEARVLEELSRLFEEEFVPEAKMAAVDASPLSWFEIELEPALGIDVFAKPFPIAEGFGCYESPRARLLLIRLEDLARCGKRAFQALGIDDFEPVQRNVGDTKGYADLYRRFRETIALPSSYLDRLYGSRLAQHFYTPDEIAAFRARWRERKA